MLCSFSKYRLTASCTDMVEANQVTPIAATTRSPSNTGTARLRDTGRTPAARTAEKCIRCNHIDCVNVCPVDCFYEGANILVIHPDECIDCGVCEPECPAQAIVPDHMANSEWLTLNARYAAKWPSISIARDPPIDAAKFDGSPIS